MRSEGWRWEERNDIPPSELCNVMWGRRWLVGGIAVALALSVTLLAFLR